MLSNCLIEIGCEELPAKLVQPLVTKIAELTEQCLKNKGLSFGQINTYATPRRLAMIITELVEETESKIICKKGPYLEYAYDAQAQPTSAATGFANSCGVEMSALKIMQDAKGKRLYYEEQAPGLALAEHLITWLAQDVFKQLQGFKTMRWGEPGNFVRPIQWLTAKLGTKTLSGQIYNVKASDFTYGHRFMSSGKLIIKDANSYLSTLRAHFVEPCSKQRRLNILAQIEQILPPGQTAVLDPELLAEVTQLVEWPVILLGSFPEKFLCLPNAALTAVLKQHQRCFVIECNGELVANYLICANLVSTKSSQIISGNNHVIAARLADACFFYDLDCAKTLSQHSERLASMVYQAKLGTMADKVQRLTKLAREHAQALGVDVDDLVLAAQLSKSDLACELVNELPEIQGKFAEHLALKEKIKQNIATALASYNNTAADPLGRALTIIDQIDHLNSFTSIGLYPTGDKDPFGLRRAATAVLNSVLALETSFNPSVLITNPKTMAIVTERFNHWCRTQNISLGYLAAVEHLLPSGDIQKIAKILLSLSQYAELSILIANFKRVNNITKKLNGPTTNARNALILEPELAVIAKLEAFDKGEIQAELLQLTELAPLVETMLDNVHIMVDDQNLSQQRQALILTVKQLFLNIADFSKIG